MKLKRRNYKFVHYTLITLIIGGGVAVMLGWILDIDELKSILPIWITMKIATALSFIISGVLIIFSGPILDKRADLSQIVLSCTTLFLLLLMFSLLMSSFFGMKTGIEEMFISESFEKGSRNAVLSSAPGRPSIGTMISFVLIASVGIIVMYSRNRPYYFLKIIGAGVTFLGLVAIIGYLISIPSLYYLVPGVSSAMAVHTAILFVFCGLATITLKGGEL